MTTRKRFQFPPRSGRSLLAALAVLACGGDTGTSAVAVTVSVQPAEELLVGVGETVDFSAVGRDAAGNPVSGPIGWSVDDPGVASIDASGVAIALAEGTTTVSAAIDGATGTALLEVYVPDDVATYDLGTSYYGRRGYVEYIPGTLPVVFSAPHGGSLGPSEIPDRTFGVTVTDRNTLELTLAVREALIALTGLAPHVVISHLHREKLDPNREIVEAAQGSPYAEQAWREFQDWISVARVTVEQGFGRGLYFDMHGHGHDIDRVEIGYLLSAGDLNRPDVELDALAVVASSSIRDLGRESPLPFSQLLRGATSFGGYLQAEGVRSIPSPGDPSPGSDPYFTGGYNTREHGSRSDGEVISGMQLEHHFEGLRDTDEQRRAYAERLTRALRDYMLAHYGFFTPGG